MNALDRAREDLEAGLLNTTALSDGIPYMVITAESARTLLAATAPINNEMIDAAYAEWKHMGDRRTGWFAALSAARQVAVGE